MAIFYGSSSIGVDERTEAEERYYRDVARIESASKALRRRRNHEARRIMRESHLAAEAAIRRAVL